MAIFNDISGFFNTRITDPLNQRSFVFIDATDWANFALSSMISVNSVDIPDYNTDVRTLEPLNSNGTKNYIGQPRVSGDLSLQRGVFAHDFYNFALYESLISGENSGLLSLLTDTWLPRRNFILIHHINFRFLQWNLFNHTDADMKEKPEAVAQKFLEQSAVMDGMSLFNGGIPGVVYLFKDCLLSELTLSDGFDATSTSISFSNLSYTVGDMRVDSIFSASLWKNIGAFFRDD